MSVAIWLTGPLSLTGSLLEKIGQLTIPYRIDTHYILSCNFDSNFVLPRSQWAKVKPAAWLASTTTASSDMTDTASKATDCSLAMMPKQLAKGSQITENNSLLMFQLHLSSMRLLVLHWRFFGLVFIIFYLIQIESTWQSLTVIWFLELCCALLCFACCFSAGCERFGHDHLGASLPNAAARARGCSSHSTESKSQTSAVFHRAKLKAAWTWA